VSLVQRVEATGLVKTAAGVIRQVGNSVYDGELAGELMGLLLLR
jgi:hypothetical protein